jgi:predicted Fe-S protein YdhL (DUF1289 family)
MTGAPPSSPCVKLCKIDPAAGLCASCLRTLAEIRAWGGMSEAERLAVMRDLKSRSKRAGTALDPALNRG